MSLGATLHWLPAASDWRARLKSLLALPPGSAEAWGAAVALANTRLDFLATNALDQAIGKLFAGGPPPGMSTRPVRLAILSSATTAHLHPAIRVGALRRRIFLTTYENEYGQYLQELLDPGSALHAFQPNAALFVLDAHHLTGGIEAGLEEAAARAAIEAIVERLGECWRLAAALTRGPVLQQTVLDVFPALFGSNEQRLPGSPAAAVARLNARLREAAEYASIDLVAVDRRAAQDGIGTWHNVSLWHRSKQEIAVPVAPLYGDLVGRVLAARQGLSAKCLVLDLDNTVWGGVIGDDGVDGIALGQGSALGEAFVAVQRYAKELTRRGIILAVCSKNDETSALEPFASHPEMVLRRDDVACFVANWQDKPSNLRLIAATLNIGIESLVFLDDNPFERELMRQELPMVGVPEVPDEPGTYPFVLADAGYFEGVAVTTEDRERSGQYQSNMAREALRASATDLESYLRKLEMRLLWRRFDRVGLQRTVQLINKTNQFNLMTRRYTGEEVEAVMGDPHAVGLQLRLVDRFGDNGIIAILIGRLDAARDMVVDTWLMSCRVLGRQVEQTTLNLLAAEAKRMGARRLVGEYRPTKKNGMVRDHYPKLGFEPAGEMADGVSRFVLDLSAFQPPHTFIHVQEG